jgi:hypothetical protein
MAMEHESHQYDFRKGGEVKRPKAKAKPASKGEDKAKTAAPVGDLTAKKRKALAASTFGLPAKRKYPMPDKSHAAKAKGRATEMVRKGKLSKAAEDEIDAKANRILGE